MLRNLVLVAAYLAMLGIGIGAPFILVLGYVWVDLFRPGDIVYGALQSIPFALLMGTAVVGGYFMLDRRDPPRIGAITLLTLFFALWVTMTTLWAVVPDAAWNKWDWAVKTVAFSAIIPFVIRSRNQIEAFILVYIFTVAAQAIPFGVKTLISGGGYGRELGLLKGNSFLANGEQLSMACLLAVPFIVFAMKHGRIFPRNNFVNIGYLGLVVLILATCIGTYERTGLVGIGALGVGLWIYSKRKIVFGALCAAVVLVMAVSVSDEWQARMSTISDPGADSSASGRLEMWKWTYEFAKMHPFGGGFEASRVSNIRIETGDGEDAQVKVQRGRAFHSSYFEVLGEHGWVGLGAFLGLLFFSIRALRQVTRLSRDKPPLAWCGDLSYALQVCLAVFMICGAFIGIAFQPYVYYLFALSCCLREYVRRVLPATAAAALQPNEGFALGHASHADGRT